MIDENVQVLVGGVNVSDTNPMPVKVVVSGAGISASHPLPTVNESVDEALTTILAVLGKATDAAGANTVIGQLKQIATNTTTAG